LTLKLKALQPFETLGNSYPTPPLREPQIWPEYYTYYPPSSTADATFQLTNHILNAWNNKLHTGGIFCDLAKAFDCINHEILLLQLKYCDIQDTILDWFLTYLTSRKQRAK
jgi:hypothetical protein